MKALHFETSRPVEGNLFVNRHKELERLNSALDKLESGRSAFIAVLGFRKQGKSSLFQEWMRTNCNRRGIIFVPVQCWAWPDPEDFFREYIRLTINAALTISDAVHEVGLLSSITEPGQIVKLAAYATRKNLSGLVGALELMTNYASSTDRANIFREAVRLPERLAVSDSLRIQFVLDEFQELAGFNNFKIIRQAFGSIYAMLREEWQQQRHCNYIISGSAISLIRQIIEDPAAPFFQHFTSLHLGPLPEMDALTLLTKFSSQSGCEIPVAICQNIISLVGTNPYYLQILGEELVLSATGRKPDMADWKKVCQRVLLQPSGRLYQYFEQMHQNVVKKSSVLEKILKALSNGPARGSEIAASLGVTQNRLSSKLPMIEAQDVITKTGVNYHICDPCYKVWLLSAQGPRPNVTAPLLLGNEAEKQVAREVARQGVNLVYQSKASRGAFDLLAIYQSYLIGVQVKKVKKYPVYISESSVGRMREDANIFNWFSVLAFICDDDVFFHALTQGRFTKRGRCFKKDTALRHILDIINIEK